MPVLSELDIHEALERLAVGLDRYKWLQDNVCRCNVAEDRTFQRRFDRFYRVRRNSEWREAFFTLMEKTKRERIDFARTLSEIRSATGRIEASFASKLVATLEPSKPVVDRFVLRNFRLRLPSHGVANREQRTIEVYQELCCQYRDFIDSPDGVLIRRMFDIRYPDAEIGELKKIDLVLWQAR